MQPRLKAIFNKQLSPSLSGTGYNLRIEQYRGLCALLVMLYHGSSQEDILLDNFSWPGYVHYLGAGHLSVIIFFCISGYVIGLTNSMSDFNVGNYLKHRAVRLYPIYIVSILLCVAVAGNAPFFELLGNLFFLQNFFPYFNLQVPVFINFATWSLNYEALYYILFIGLFFWRPKVWKLLLSMLALTILFINTGHSLSFFANYINGFYFWVLGLIIAWNIFKSETAKDTDVPLLSMLFLQISLHHLGMGHIILNTINIRSDTNIDWLFDLPFCLMVMGILTSRDNTFFRFNKILSYGLPVFVFAYLVLHHRLTEDIRWIMCLIFWALSLLFYFETKVSGFLMNKLTGVGKISYSIYLLHVPVAMLIHKTVFIPNRTIEIVIKYILWFSVTFALSYLLERVLQPVIKRFFFPKPTVQSSLSGS